MLTRIYSPAFKIDGHERDVIVLRPGLNTVLGAFDAKNSIGKSTFLNVIDFVLGGSTLAASKPLKDNVGNHTIFFTFKFNDELYHFSRATGKPKTIKQYSDPDWKEEIEEWSLKEYGAFLKDHYGLGNCEGNWRQIISRFSRIQAKASRSAEEPLRAASGEPQATGITVLQQLLGVYDRIVALEKEAETKKQDYEAVKRVRKMQLDSLKMLNSEKQAEKVAKDLAELRQQQKQVLQHEDARQLELQLSLADRKAEIKQQLMTIRNQISLARARVKHLEATAELRSGIAPRDIDDLRTYFPDANLRRIEQATAFHRELLLILNQEIGEEIEKYQAEIASLNAQMAPLKTELTTAHNGVEMDEDFLNRVKELEFEISAKERQLQLWKDQKRIEGDKKKSQDELDSKRKEINYALQAKINKELEKLSDIISGGETEAPRLQFSDTAKSFEFFTPNDDGTGTSTKGVILLDLVLMELTSLPVVIHDSPLFQSLDYPTTGKILELYEQSDKQIFIAFDRHTSYHGTPAVERIVEKTAVVKVGPNEKALYGSAWNKRKKEQNNG